VYLRVWWGERRWHCEIVDKDDNDVTKEVDGVGGMVMLTLGTRGCWPYPIILSCRI